MNIKRAKEEIKDTIQAYLLKDEYGEYEITPIRQRPVLLLGAPGIGKTQIMEQIAQECKIGLVSYTITHHTRQSAIGLPFISQKEYGGKPYSVTEYTMSEIVASVYEKIEHSGLAEGILFIDEINCVSETLAPTMLQFLQNKTFGSHKVPAGWVIVAAGNPREYNKSVREFDIVTLDRVKRIVVEEDCGVWMEYAWTRKIHGAILSYLSIKPENFYSVENGEEEKAFVTARGWEDLSEILKSYEELQLPVDWELVVQYLQQEETARDFTAYYQLFCKYGADYKIEEMLEGRLSPEEYESTVHMAENGAFEERFTVISLVLSGLDHSFVKYGEGEEFLHRLHQALGQLRDYLGSREGMEAMAAFLDQRKASLAVKVERELISLEEEGVEAAVTDKLEEYYLEIKLERLRDCGSGFARIKELFRQETARRRELISRISSRLERGFAFVEQAFGGGQEMVMFVTGLSRNKEGMGFIQTHGCEGYFIHSRELLFKEKEEELKREIKSMQEEL